MNTQAVIGNTQLILQLLYLVLELFDFTLFCRLRRSRPWRRLVQTLDSVLGILTPPVGQLVAVEFLSSKQSTQFTVLASIGFLDDTQLILGFENAPCALFQLRIWCDLAIGSL